MNAEIFKQLLIVALLPVVFAALFYLLQRKSSFPKMPYWLQQLIIGIVFGIAACMGTEHGVDVGGATANARDAAPLCAGLLFGAPSGIIAGVIGGVERWFAASWGAGEYSKIACSVSTVLAGCYAALLRRYMFDNKRPTPTFGLFIALVMEILHLSILFLTHLSDSAKAYEIVKIVTLPMVFCNSISVFMACLVLSLISNGLNRGEKHKPSISQRVQGAMLVCVVFAYLATTSFVYILQTNTAVMDAKELLTVTLSDVTNEISDSGEEPATLLATRHIGSDGYIVVAKTDGTILGKKYSEAATLAEAGFDMQATLNTMNTASIYGEDCYYMISCASSRYICAVLPESEVFDSRDAAAYVNSFMEVLVFAAFFAMIYGLIKRLVVVNIRTVNERLEQIIGGDLTVKVNVRSSTEFSSLSDDINSTVSTLKHYIDEASARIDRELEFAKSIQLSSLPSKFPAFQDRNEFDIYATMATAKEVGGDFYDLYMRDSETLIFMIADVSGKGIPAAMFMMRAKTMIKNLAEEGLSADRIFTEANTRLCEGNDAGMFVTAWMGILNIKTGHICFANAGHNPPLVYRKGEGYSYLRSRAGLVLAGMDGVKYKPQELDLKPGDKIYLYTDGVTEATNSSTMLYGEERLNSFLNTITERNVCDTLHLVKEDLDCFVGEAEQFDDITMLGIEFFGEAKSSETRTFKAKLEELENANAFVEEILGKADCPMKAVMQIAVAFEEVFVNVAHYAYGEGEGDVTIGVTAYDGRAEITVTDSGVPFNPLERDDPDITLSADERQIGGLGIFMVKKTMDSVKYEYRDNKNILTMKKSF